MFRRSIKTILRRFGYDIVKYSPANSPRVRRRSLLDSLRVTVVLDVGANVGQFGSELREDGYRGRIASFEPLHAAFRTLAARADEQWECFEIAIGANDGEATLNVAEDTWSSSLRHPNPRLVAAAPAAATVRTETVAVRTLDTLSDELLTPEDRAFLKVDAQGYEQEVLAGAGAVLDRIVGLELELSLVPLYEGQSRLPQLLETVDELGYRLVGLGSGFTDPVSHDLLQLDALFARRDTVRKPVDHRIQLPA
jgi:FkbM family methyltransferase